jgi:hypothetical protein
MMNDQLKSESLRKVIGLRLQVEVELAGLTKLDLAQATTLSLDKIEYYLVGKCGIDFAEVQQMCTAVGCSLYDIIGQGKLWSTFKKQKEFLDRAGNADPVRYARFIQEEAEEFEAAYFGDCPTREHVVQEACDVIFVAAGFLNSFLGTEKAEQAFDILCDVNMKKFGGDLRDENGKVVMTKERKAELKAELLGRLKELCDL